MERLSDRPVRLIPKGTDFVRYAIALARGKGDLLLAAEIAKRWRDSPGVEIALKAAVAAGTTIDSTWAAPLVPFRTMGTEFIDMLRPLTIVGRIPGIRTVPFLVSLARATAGSSAGWIGQGLATPVSRMIRGFLTQVPEPTTLALLAFGLAGLGFARRRKKS